MRLRESVSWLMGTLQRNLIPGLEECCERPLTESSSAGELHPHALPGRVEDWRAYGRVRWLIQGFRPGPQSGSLGNVSSPRHVKPGVRFSRTGLSC
jgi:hypothetical protein